MLNSLKNNDGSTKKKRRVGRGIGSGRGKTSGRGGKGQTARSGVAIKGFEGGQMPLARRLPKVGFSNFNRKTFVEVNLGRIQKAIERGVLDPKQLIDATLLREKGFYKKSFPLKILGNGELTCAIRIEADKISSSAQEKITSSGGTWTIQKTADLIEEK